MPEAIDLLIEKYKRYLVNTILHCPLLLFNPAHKTMAIYLILQKKQ